METKVNALCLRALDYRDNDKLLTLISADLGKFSAIMKGVKSPKAKLRLAASPLCFGEYILLKNGNNTIVKGCHVYDNFFTIWTNSDKALAAFSIIEILEKFVLEKERADREVILALNSLKTLNYSDVNPLSVVAFFLSKLFYLQGIDVTDFKMDNELKIKIKALSCISVDDLEGFDAEKDDIIKLIKHLHYIIGNTLSIKINTLNQIINKY